jgi:hypothetical protein
LCLAACIALCIRPTEAQHPPMNLYTTFVINTLVVYKWDGKDLKPFNDFKAQVLVDSTRNKVMIHATMDMGNGLNAQVDTLIDLTDGVSFTTIPMLDICQY